MVIVFIPTIIVVAVIILLLFGGTWVLGNFFVGLLPGLNFLFLPLELAVAYAAFSATTQICEGKGGRLFALRAALFSLLGFIVSVQAWFWSSLGTDGYAVNAVDRVLTGADGEAVPIHIDNTYRALNYYGAALQKVLIVAAVFVGVVIAISFILKGISEAAGGLLPVLEILSMAVMVVFTVQFINYSNLDIANQQINWAEEHSKTVGECRLMEDSNPNQSMLMNFKEDDTPGTTMFPYYKKVKAGTVLTVTSKSAFDIWMNRNIKYVECYTADGVYGYFRADLLEGYEAE